MTAAFPSTLDRVKKIIGDRIAKDWREFSEQTDLQNDLLCDSLDLAEILMDIEDAFGLRYGQLDNIPRTIGGIVAVLEHEMAKTRAKT